MVEGDVAGRLPPVQDDALVLLARGLDAVVLGLVGERGAEVG
jgi:hypothetical protein